MKKNQKEILKKQTVKHYGVSEKFNREWQSFFNKATSVLFVSDLQVGAMTSACSSKPLIRDKDTYYTPSVKSKAVNKVLHDGTKRLLKKKTDVLVIVGEGIDGANPQQQGNQSWTTNQLDQVNDCVKLLHELFEWKVCYVSRGSKYHVQNGAVDYDDILAEKLGANKNSPFGGTNLTDDYGYLNVHGVVIQYAHHISYAKNPWSKGSPLAKEALLCELNESTRAHLYVRGHVHSCDGYWGYIGDNDYPTQIFTNPCAKYPDSFLMKAGMGGTIPNIGFTEVLVFPNGQYYINPIVAQPKIPKQIADVHRALRGK